VKFWANSVIWKNFNPHSLFLRKRYNDAPDNFLLVSKRSASKLIQGASADPITRGYLRGGIALKLGQYRLNAKVLQ
jgi:hypothetical protein